MKVLITGGAGYIGSTIASCCADNGIEPVILDNYSTGLRSFSRGHIAYEGDIADATLVREIFNQHPEIDSVIHCAAQAVVPDSVRDPLAYYETNVAKSLALVREIRARGIRRFVFSSSASVYGQGDAEFVVETDGLLPQSPYAASKWMMECILRDLARAGQMNSIALRYFNPIGADPRRRTGPQKLDPDNALGKMIAAREVGRAFTVTGAEWPTRDGTGLRDFVHVWDIARAHVGATTVRCRG